MFQALDQFKQDPTLSVIILSMRSGAVGLTLTAANRVYLMEPALNPAIEMQAITRVRQYIHALCV